MSRSRKYRSSQIRGIGIDEVDYADGCDRFVTNVVLPEVQSLHPVAGVLLTMPIGLIAGLHRAIGSGYIAQADRMEAEHAAAKATAALNRGSRAHGCRW
ncbi:hypothetical protein KBY83_05870 [Cyanobium sp. WKJ7-Wakatipu]|uniref:hypothetical protein n=1 Tax=Cyanobium sp. WKJ7-Wakatipu TaxID=2823726 RepID=UPI0020CF7BD5|nr:hypothetical protein [Cyanobium sp. WKJ7-Wakatipu]MCP9782849.1 hypothetical protein [Cyanobium sp. WKJ7-Wakatipu]